MFTPLPQETEQTARHIVDAAYKVHSNLGPGLLESIYEVCLAYELEKRSIRFQKQKSFPVSYDGVQLNASLRIDLFVNNCIIVELKAVDILHPVHEAQLITYLKLTGIRLGFLINFNVPQIREGINRRIL